MPGIRRTKDRDGRYHPKFRFWFMDWQGVRQWRTGTSSRAETLAIARRLEDEHRQIRLGYRSPPRLSDKDHDFDEIVEEYLAWGKSHGGRGGRPWGKTHVRMRTSLLAWWKGRLGLSLLRDLVGSLSRVERALGELQSAGRAGKTLQNYADSLLSLCNWCVFRGYLVESPFKGLVKFDATPKTTRRAVTPDEIRCLLAVCSPARRDTYEVALASGLRAGELRALRVKHLNVRRCGLYLEAAWTKNRKPGFQPLPAALVAGLAESSSGKAPDDPLLYVPSHPARELDKDLQAAAIPKWTPEGKVDFHALRVAYTTLLIESGANVKEAQVLVRHSTPGLTMDKYARARMDRLHALVETSAAMFAPGLERTPSSTRRAAGDRGVFG
ncbi:MAG: tyrosine-type recombinase/integrase [Planctomycetota bacterium]